MTSLNKIYRSRVEVGGRLLSRVSYSVARENKCDVPSLNEIYCRYTFHLLRHK